MASKATSATINETPLSQADPFVKMSVTAILSGMASKASGGDFVQGALSAMVVWLYNDLVDYIKKQSEGRKDIASIIRKKAILNAILNGENLNQTSFIGITGSADYGNSSAGEIGFYYSVKLEDGKFVRKVGIYASAENGTGLLGAGGVLRLEVIMNIMIKH